MNEGVINALRRRQEIVQQKRNEMPAVVGIAQMFASIHAENARIEAQKQETELRLRMMEAQITQGQQQFDLQMKTLGAQESRSQRLYELELKKMESESARMEIADSREARKHELELEGLRLEKQLTELRLTGGTLEALNALSKIQDPKLRAHGYKMLNLEEGQDHAAAKDAFLGSVNALGGSYSQSSGWKAGTDLRVMISALNEFARAEAMGVPEAGLAKSHTVTALRDVKVPITVTNDPRTGQPYPEPKKLTFSMGEFFDTQDTLARLSTSKDRTDEGTAQALVLASTKRDDMHQLLDIGVQQGSIKKETAESLKAMGQTWRYNATAEVPVPLTVKGIDELLSEPERYVSSRKAGRNPSGPNYSPPPPVLPSQAASSQPVTQPGSRPEKFEVGNAVVDTMKTLVADAVAPSWKEKMEGDPEEKAPIITALKMLQSATKEGEPIPITKATWKKLGFLFPDVVVNMDDWTVHDHPWNPFASGYLPLYPDKGEGSPSRSPQIAELRPMNYADLQALKPLIESRDYEGIANLLKTLIQTPQDKR